MQCDKDLQFSIRILSSEIAWIYLIRTVAFRTAVRTLLKFLQRFVECHNVERDKTSRAVIYKHLFGIVFQIFFHIGVDKIFFEQRLAHSELFFQVILVSFQFSSYEVLSFQHFVPSTFRMPSVPKSSGKNSEKNQNKILGEIPEKKMVIKRSHKSNFQEDKSWEPNSATRWKFDLLDTYQQASNSINFQRERLSDSPDLCTWKFKIQLRFIITFNYRIINPRKFGNKDYGVNKQSKSMWSGWWTKRRMSKRRKINRRMPKRRIPKRRKEKL